MREKSSQQLPIIFLSDNPGDIKYQLAKAFSTPDQSEVSLCKELGTISRNTLRQLKSSNGARTSFESTLVTLAKLGYQLLVPADDPTDTQPDTKQWEYGVRAVRVPKATDALSHEGMSSLLKELEKGSWEIVTRNEDHIIGHYRTVSFIVKRPKVQQRVP